MSPSAIQPKRNIEIKARIQNEQEFEKRINIAKELTKTEGEILMQHDIFYNVREGRLKLRNEVSYLSICIDQFEQLIKYTLDSAQQINAGTI